MIVKDTIGRDFNVESVSVEVDRIDSEIVYFVRGFCNHGIFKDYGSVYLKCCTDANEAFDYADELKSKLANELINKDNSSVIGV